MKAVGGWLKKFFWFNDENVVIAVPAREKWLVVVAFVCLVAMNAGLVVYYFNLVVSMFLLLLGAAGTFSLFYRWNRVPLKVQRQNAHRAIPHWFAYYFLMFVAAAVFEVLIEGSQMVFMSAILLFVSVQLAMIFAKMYKRAGECAPPSPFDFPRNVDER